MKGFSFPFTTNTVGYQRCLLLTATTSHPQIDAIQEEVDYLLLGKVPVTPVVEGLLEGTISAGDTGAGKPTLAP